MELRRAAAALASDANHQRPCTHASPLPLPSMALPPETQPTPQLTGQSFKVTVTHHMLLPSGHLPPAN